MSFPVTIGAGYDDAAMRWAQGQGNNTVQGHAVLRTRGGDAKTCAAMKAHLIPDSEYGRSRLTILYGNLQNGSRDLDAQRYHFQPDSPGFSRDIRTEVCDAQGNFEFRNVPDGIWYVQAIVAWDAPRIRTQGASMLTRVEVRGGQTKKVVLTR